MVIQEGNATRHFVCTRQTLQNYKDAPKIDCEQSLFFTHFSGTGEGKARLHAFALAENQEEFEKP